MTHLRSRIDEFEVDVLQLNTLGALVEWLSQNQRSFLGTDAAAADDDEVVFDFTVVREATDWCDVLFGEIVFSAGVAFLSSRSHAVNALVLLGSVVVTALTSTSDCEADSLWVPSADTTDSAKTSVGLARQLADTKSANASFESETFRDTDHVDDVIGSEDLVDLNFLLEQTVTEVDLVRSSFASVDLDFENVGLALRAVEEFRLSVADQSDNRAVLFNAVEDDSGVFVVLRSLFSVLLEHFLLGSVPVAAESAFEFFREVLSPNGRKRAKAAKGFGVADQTNHSHRRSFDHGDCFNNFLFVEVGSCALNFANDMSHASLEAGKGCQMRRLGVVIFGEGSNSSAVVTSSSFRQESQVSASGFFIFSVGHRPFIIPLRCFRN